ncbi:HpcH/HpaI aldolase/citrate lyase family protein [Methylobacterium sp. J-067]|jgi:citrate lyase subunit beta/citryl-CoA lyase|uniref:HpcH/HpaI aldolase/citrate lyase family protein n=1 Tax=Methylobacterium sp. J-067 TaxID=2836648 RepID=UPI001FB9C5D9|nr:CoA ester lyase [Methylobacterium sp. J-067]MCJ2024015.1 CoA ester lyase [Methylobacterium sp. J-067]
MSLYRSFLFAPGNHARRTEKALSLGADAVILDLEDACPAAEKIATRAVVVEALQRPRKARGYVRVNPLSTEYGYGDIVATVRAGVDGLVIPKIERADELRTAVWLVEQIEREQGLEPGALDLLPIIETGIGLANVRAIAEAGTRVHRLAFGAGDFTLDLDIAWSADEAEFAPYRAAMVLASRAAGLEPPIDTVWVNLPDTDGFARSAARARAMGFQGKLCIHPDQITMVHAAFSPSADQITWATKVVAAFEEAERTGSAAIRVDGQFIDYPFVYKARRILVAAQASDVAY